MRIHRIRLHNYRGVVDRVVEPDPTGVTVVEGPNEIGKSSLAEALDLILENLDDTKKQAVRRVQPVDRDVGPEVEVDLELGPYRFSFSKRFLKRPETLLRITAPKPENYTGREAHERVQRILAEGLDSDLWKALRVLQDRGVDQACLAHAASLTQALDRAAGGEVAGERDHGIFEAVRAEYCAYFTETGHPKKLRTDAAMAVQEAQCEVSGLERELRAVEELVDRAASLERRVVELKQRVLEADSIKAAREKEVSQIAQQEEKLALLRLKSTQAAEAAQRRLQESKARQELVGRVRQAATQVAELRQREAGTRAAFEQATAALDTASMALEKAEKEAGDARSQADIGAKDEQYHRDRLDLELLGERRQRIESWRAEREQAQETLDRTKVDDQLLEQLRKANGELVRLGAQLEAGSPRLRITALAELAFDLGPAARALRAGESFEETVGERTSVRIPGVAEVEVIAGTSLNELVTSRDKAQARLRCLLDQAGIEGLEEAEHSRLARRDAEQKVEAADRAIEQDLRDLTVEEMLGRIARLESRVESYPATRAATMPMPVDLDAARTARQRAEERREQADSGLRAQRARHEAASRQFREILAVDERTRFEVAFHTKLVAEHEHALGIARNHRVDSQLARDLEQAQDAVALAESAWETAQQALRGEDPDRVRHLASNAQNACARLARELRQSEDELNAALANLELLGAKGLYDALEDARARLEHALGRRRQVDARAAAASLLYETMKRERDAARRAYAAPLRAKILELGRYLYDPTFDVELDDRLAIIQRTSGGLTLPFESLSVGAKEQLGLIVRLACSLLVDPADGVPLIFDDTLGHTDPERLEGMGALLSHAGEHCQIIILTCSPNRFQHIGAARAIRLVAGEGGTVV
ncbi:MAG: hypothetical protein JW940_08675 [Polyangiaceae bacterium]|nr:hypothetical protein [Polyangiaceae bacterium]